MRQLVDDEYGGSAPETGVEIEFVAYRAAIAHGQERQLLQPFEKTLGLDASVRLDVTDDEIDTARAYAARGLEHRVGLADTGARAEEDAQLAAPGPRLLRVDGRQQLIGIGPDLVHLPGCVSRFIYRAVYRAPGSIRAH